MSGKAKQALAILAALGITASGVVDLLNHIMATFPNPKLHMICSGVITLIGLAVAVFPVSVRNPNPVDTDKTPAESPNARTKQTLGMLLPFLLLPALLASGCATTSASQLAADEAKAKIILADVAADAGPVTGCSAQIAVAVASAIMTANWAALAGLEPCIANAISLIYAQVTAYKAAPPPLMNVKVAQTLHAVAKATPIAVAK